MTTRAALCAWLFTMVLTVACGQSRQSRPTVVTLALESTATVLPAGQVVKLVAQVAADHSAVSRGLVRFCDADGSDCKGAAVLGTAQLDSRGTAIIRLRLGPGKHRLRAVFSGTPNSIPANARSASEVQTITIGEGGGTRDGGLR